MAQDTIEKAFLSELEALEKFRISYTSQYPNVPLAREDPDVRRLIEAMAMFTARTRVAAERSVADSMLRLFRQHFPNVLSPVPAMAMIRASATARFTEQAELPRGSEIVLLRNPGLGAPEQLFRFRTLSKLRVLPIELTAADMFRVRGKGVRLLLRFESQYPRKLKLGDLSLQVNHLDDLRSSMTVLFELKSHLKHASVSFEKVVREDTQGAPSQVRFGSPEIAKEEYDAFDHPLQRARSFLHFPQQELFLNVSEIKQPNEWQHFTLCLDLDDSWAPELRLTKDAFRLHVVAAANVRKDMSNPIECDGTKERYSVRHPDPTMNLVPMSVLGAYRMTDQGLVPLEPAVLGARRESYDALVEGDDEKRRASVVLNLPNAFRAPERVAVEALWHQPALRGIETEEFRVRPWDRHLEGLDWALSGTLVSHATSELGNDKERLLQLLSIKNQRFLGTDEMLFLLHALGAHEERAFAKLVSAIVDVKVESKPFARRSNAFKYIYELQMGDLDSSDLSRLDLFGGKLLELLAAWSVEEIVELVLKVPNLGKELRYT